MAYINNKSQSLVELAVFGALLIGLLATLISYGLRNKYQQQILQQTYRKAMAVTQEKVKHKKPGGGTTNLGRRGSATYAYVRERHTPDPTNPFGVGTVSPYSSSATITRDFRLNETARYPEELPIVVINIPNQNNQTLTDQLWTLTTAGFSDRCVPKLCPEGPIKKYEEIYGYSNFWKLKRGSYEACVGGRYGIPFTCPSSLENGDPIPCTRSSGAEGYVYRAIDYCEGDIMNYDGCKLQCGKFQDLNICVKECARSRMDWDTAEAACTRICQAQTDVPWYCRHLASIFPASGSVKPKDMGLQQDYAVDSTRSNLLKKTEDKGTIKTTDTLNWSDTTNREIVIIKKVYGPSGVISFNREHQAASSTVSVSEDIDLK